MALIAPDGGGKTTLARLLQESTPLTVKVIYMGLYRPPSSGRTALHVPGPGLVFRLLRAWARYGLGRFHRALGRIVVFDRYTYDALLTPPEQLNALGRGHRYLLGNACPAPDLTILLDVDPQILRSRKDEHGLHDLAEQRQRFLDLAGRRPEIVVVDASRPLEEVNRDVTALVWSAYRGRESS